MNSPPSPPLTAPPATPSSTIGRFIVDARRHVIPRASFLDKELQLVGPQNTSQKELKIPVREDSTLNMTINAQDIARNEPLPGISSQLTSHVARLSVGSQMAHFDASLVLDTFNQRVHANINDSVYISPNHRESFEKMLWTVMVVSHPNLPIQPISFEDSTIPHIKAVPGYCASLNLPKPIQVKVDTLGSYLVRTEALLRYYPIPSGLLIEFRKIASEINGCIFSRLMGSRGAWSFHRCYGGTLILLRWWAATMPEVMTEYCTALSAKAQDPVLRSKLRRELQDTLILSDESNLDLFIRDGVDQVSTFRRRMWVAVLKEFDHLVEEAKASSSFEKAA